MIATSACLTPEMFFWTPNERIIANALTDDSA
jgi:hypothetical protein